MRDGLNAVLNTERRSAYSSSDPDLARKRDSYYYSVPIERLTAAKENVGKWFDVGYCVRKAMSILNAREADADLLDWATHLTRLAKVMEPTSNRTRLVEARCLLLAANATAGFRYSKTSARARRAPATRRSVVHRDEDPRAVLPRRTEPPGPRAEGVFGLQGVPQERGGHALPDRQVLRGAGRPGQRREVLQRGDRVRGAPADTGTPRKRSSDWGRADGEKSRADQGNSSLTRIDAPGAASGETRSSAQRACDRYGYARAAVGCGSRKT